MRAVRLVESGRPLQMQYIEIPEPGPRDVLVRVKAAGICHSDAHYRAGVSKVAPLPRTLGHEVAGIIEKCGSDVSRLKEGDRVCIHYMATCGDCDYCNRGHEQFCVAGKMIGKHRDGGYADYILVPARSAFPIPQDIPWTHAAIMMCSSATSLHALRKARLKPGESVAVFGAGGLGMSAIQLSFAFGAGRVYAIDLNPAKLALASRFGAIPVDPAKGDPVSQIRELTSGRGVDVALELIGIPMVMEQAVRCLSVLGRAAIAGITDQTFEVAPYEQLLGREAEIIGVSDHLAEEIPLLVDLAARGRLQLGEAITRTIPLDDGSINSVLDSLEKFESPVRVVIEP